MAAAATPTASAKACWSNTGGAWLAPRGRPLRPRPRLAIYTCQMATTLFNLISVELVMHMPITSGLNNHEPTRSSPKWGYLPTTPFFFNKIQNFLGHFVFRTPKVIIPNIRIPLFFLYTLCHAYIFFPTQSYFPYTSYRV